MKQIFAICKFSRICSYGYGRPFVSSLIKKAFFLDGNSGQEALYEWVTKKQANASEDKKKRRNKFGVLSCNFYDNYQEWKDDWVESPSYFDSEERKQKIKGVEKAISILKTLNEED